VGLGANGTGSTSSASSATAWTQLSTGEGGTVAIDQTNPLLWYVSTAAGVSIRQCSNGAACSATNFTGAPTIGSAQVSNDDSLIDVPWLLDPALSSDILIGTCRVWRGGYCLKMWGSHWRQYGNGKAHLRGDTFLLCTPSTTNPGFVSMVSVQRRIVSLGQRHDNIEPL